MIRALGPGELRGILKQSGVRMSKDTKAGAGRTFAVPDGPLRTVNAWIGGPRSQGYVADVAARVLALRHTWVIVPRFGGAADLALVESGGREVSLLFDAEQFAPIAAYLSTYRFVRAIYSDLWLFPSDGGVVVLWGHHAPTQGLDIQLSSIEETTTLLRSLNELGAELQLFSRL